MKKINSPDPINEIIVLLKDISKRINAVKRGLAIYKLSNEKL